jgi:hypothetical protein
MCLVIFKTSQIYAILYHGVWAGTSGNPRPNPKHEARNPKQIQKKPNYKSQTAGQGRESVCHYIDVCTPSLYTDWGADMFLWGGDFRTNWTMCSAGGVEVDFVWLFMIFVLTVIGRRCILDTQGSVYAGRASTCLPGV